MAVCWGTFSLSLLHCQARCRLSLDSSCERKTIFIGQVSLLIDAVSGTSLKQVAPPLQGETSLVFLLVGRSAVLGPITPAMTCVCVVGSPIQDRERWFLTGLKS